ncbi:MAG: Rieske (2Fe-2S) protein [Actinomycetota bacterium]|nr:Rieske (2Fe-2S) protein [Actinomycetota bacterium]
MDIADHERERPTSRREVLLARLEASELFDRADAAVPRLQRLIGSGRMADLLTGRPLGHPTHPVAILAPMSCFVGASVVDVVGGRAGRTVARRLTGLGLVTSLPALASGAADWTTTDGAERRVGTAHAALNATALWLFARSSARRGRGAGLRGALLGLAGNTVLGAAGYLGGHLAYRRGVGVDTTAFLAGPTAWEPLAPVADLAIDQPVRVEHDGVPFVAVRRPGGAIAVLEDRCTHRGGPLHDGELVDDCIRCPWHGATFDLTTGAVVAGPATAPAPSYEVRVEQSMVEIRRNEPSTLRVNPARAAS